MLRQRPRTGWTLFVPGAATWRCWDRMLPGMDGLDVLRQTRGAGVRTPVLMLTALDAVGDRVAGLDAGADDYLAKPFAAEELLARVRALGRRPSRVGGRHRPAPGRCSTGALLFAFGVTCPSVYGQPPLRL